jgi:hypothetical protein
VRWQLGAFITASLFAAPAHAQQAQHARDIAKPNEAYVLIDGPKEATLEQQDQDRWIRVCAAPCDRPFPIGKTYRIAGEDVRESPPFVLAGKAGSTVTLHFSESKHDTGKTLVEGGVIVTLVGGLTLFSGLFGSCSDSSGSDECSSYHWLAYTGGALAVVGVTAIVSGIVLMVQGADASIDQTSVAKIPQIVPFSARFRAEADAPRLSLQPIPTTPIFTVSF